ncbi:MAG: BlaI/MecI/CopY family transcriptional regulator [Phycisphaerales bacterium]|nr:MAG: BlaI/MecI/CopY family transcriptional regulator [Phycisphaerales bacterium]
MARPGNEHPTDRELTILNVLWERGPSRLSAICGALRQGGSAAPSTVATMLKIMRQKGFVERVSSDKGVVWEARLTHEEAGSGMLETLMNRLFDGSARKVVLHLLEGGELSRKDREEIRRVLETTKKAKR